MSDVTGDSVSDTEKSPHHVGGQCYIYITFKRTAYMTGSRIRTFSITDPSHSYVLKGHALDQIRQNGKFHILTKSQKFALKYSVRNYLRCEFCTEFLFTFVNMFRSVPIGIVHNLRAPESTFDTLHLPPKNAS